jgi:ubiquinone/menaquinone biosynthesis C-methylase UbiE
MILPGTSWNPECITILYMLSRDSASRFYDFLGYRYDWFAGYEARAKKRALECLDLAPGQLVLNVGLGTGKEHVEIQSTISPGGIAVGVDISSKMLATAKARSGAPLCQADGEYLPFAKGTFHRIYCAYVFDLVIQSNILNWLKGLWQVLIPGGLGVLVSLTEGIDRPSRSFISIWKAVYSVSPLACGGCRPLLLSEFTRQAGFKLVKREVVVQLGVPSEIVVVAK